LNICSDINAKPSIRDNNQSQNHYKKIIGIESKGHQSITLSDRKNDFLKKFPQNRYKLYETNVIPGKNLKRITIDDSGIEVIASDYIYAIILNNEASPGIILSGKHMKSRPILRVGMSLNDLEKILLNCKFSDKSDILGRKDDYRYYFDLGLAVKFNSDKNTVSEFLITSLP